MKRFLPSVLVVFIIFCISSSAQAQWKRQYPMEKLENILNIAMHQDNYGYAVGDNDLILKLDPVSQSWNPLVNLEMNWSLNAVDYVAGTNGAIVAAGGPVLIISTNGGNNWTEIAGAPTGIVDLKITSATEVLVVAVGGVFQWANNIWTDLNLPVSTGVKDGFILDENYIWVYTQGGSPAIYSTTNGGNNWAMNTEIPSPDVVRFFDTQYGVATDGRNIYQSLNGGTGWTLISSNEIHNNAQDFAFGENANVMMAATNNGEPSITQDSGRTWTKHDMGTINTKNYAVAATSDSEFWVGNDISSITRTMDSGTTWTETSGPKRSILYESFFIDRNTGMSVGSDGAILRSYDGGTHWEELETGFTNSCFCLYGLSETDIWVGANKAIFHTTDMGETWTEKLTTLGGTMNSIVAVSSSRILATTTTGILLRSTDSGTTWDTAYTASNQLRSVTKIDNQRLMATGYGGVILKSIDQGDTWTTITPPEANLQYEETYFKGEEGWMVTSSFKKVMWHTNNAGDSWTPIDLPIERFWEGVYFISPDTGIVVGRNNLEGRVYITFDGGQIWQGGHITSYPIYDVTGFPNPNGTAWISGFGSDIEVLPYCNALPAIDDFAGDLSPCESDTVMYTISSIDVAQYFWLFPNDWVPVSDLNNDSVWVKVGKNAGTISVTGSNSCGISETINMGTLPELLPRTTSLTGEESPCEGSSQTYNASGTNADQFVWSFPGDWTPTTDPSLASVTVDVGVMSGFVTVHSLNDCGTSQSLSLETNIVILPWLNGVSGDTMPCQGDIAIYTAAATDADQINWTFPGDWQIIGNQNDPTIELQVGSMSGAVTAVAMSSCGFSLPLEVNVTARQVPEVSIMQNGNSLSLSQTGSTYQWYLNGDIIDGATSSTFEASVSGEYYAIVTYANGCEAIAPPLAVIVTSIWNAEDIISILTYPNPVRDELHLQGIEGSFDYKVFDFAGQIVLQNSSTGQSIPVNTVLEGLYIIRLQQGEKTYQARFAIMR